MSLRHALLIALEPQGATGYEITKLFDQRMGHFWSASHQQIYKELSKMTQLGWVTYVEVEQQGKPNKKVYKVTSKGKKALIAWLKQPSVPHPFKDDLLMKIYAGHLVQPELLLTEVRRCQVEYKSLLQTYQTIETDFFQPHDALPVEMKYIYLTLRNGIVTINAWLKWSQEVVDFLESRI